MKYSNAGLYYDAVPMIRHYCRFDAMLPALLNKNAGA